MEREKGGAAPTIHRAKPTTKRYINNKIPKSITENKRLNESISLLPKNYSFEVHKTVHRILTLSVKSVALQLPEGLLMFSLLLSDILKTHACVHSVFVLADVTYGACCVDDLSASSLGADLLVHYGHSCLVPVHLTLLPCLYVFVDILIDVSRLVETVEINFKHPFNLILAGTIQFGSAIRAAKPELEKLGFKVLVPQSKPLSAGEVLGCTAPTVSKKGFSGSKNDETVVIFVSDGRFHLEAFMIANPEIKAYRYDPYIGKLFLEEYDHVGMKEVRRRAIERARGAKNWGIVMGTLGRQGNPRILERLEKKMRDKGLSSTVVLMSELSPTRIALFGDSVEAWVQIACPRLSIDWGDAFKVPLLTPFEAEIALGDLPGWWERERKKNADLGCLKKKSCCGCGDGDEDNKAGDLLENDKGDEVDYPMDYYAQDGGEWNSCYSKKHSRPVRRDTVASGTGSNC